MSMTTMSMCLSPIPSPTLYRRCASYPCKRQGSFKQQASSLAQQPPHKKTYQQQQQQRVTFATSSSLHIVTNLTFEYKPDLWLTLEEIQRKKRKVELFAYLLKSRRINKEDFDSTLLMGLEKHLHDDDDDKDSYVSSGSSCSKNPRRDLVEAILQEQQRQACSGIQDAEALADISRRMTQRARDRARIIGILQSL